ncbi:MAG: molybdate ABC transporter substrate-binding protein [Chloroflexi bacterium]|nr:molybdate ABC transporter substrate-binding protein [Chloroflexota bacterium]MBV9134209.1 molybdate ABC transporter substrate-binding protein [Chloroflexota bacterium]
MRRGTLRFVLALGAAVLFACTPASPPSSPRVTAAPEVVPTDAPTVALAPVLTPTPTVQLRQTEDPTAVVVFAPSLFGQALEDLGGQFMVSAHDTTGVSYRFDTGATLVSLLQQGADADVFVGVDRATMDQLQQANLLEGPPAVLADDQLALVVPTSNPQQLQSLKDLANAGVRFIVPAPASPTTTTLLNALTTASQDAAYGADFAARADRNILARDGDDQLVISRIVSGEVSAGVVFASSIDPSSRPQLQIIPLPTSVSPPVEYPIAVLVHATNAGGGRAFVQYALSAPGQAVLSRYGFTKVGPGVSNATH